MLKYPMTLALEGNEVSGSGGCNHYSGEFVNRPERLFENIRVTAMACVDEKGRVNDELMRAEDHFLSLLSSGREIKMDETPLRISTAEGSELRFAPEGNCR